MAEERRGIWTFFRTQDKVEDSIWRSLRASITEEKHMLRVAVKYLMSIGHNEFAIETNSHICALFLQQFSGKATEY